MIRRVVLVSTLVLGTLVPVQSQAADVVPIDAFVASWDNTKIWTHLFLPPGASDEQPVPLILRTHGWGGTGETTQGTGTLSKLLSAGYAVLTWDQRGFGRSGGQVEVDHPDWEGKDVSRLITHFSARPDILKVSGDPVIGMTGGSYAGGIQLMAAAIDPRIDAIAPEIAWNYLPDSLFPSNVAKLGWDTLLYAGGQTALFNGLRDGETGNYNRTIHEAYFTVLATNDPSPFNGFFEARSPKLYVDEIDAATLVIQGTIDTLFTINQGVANYDQIRDNLRPDNTPVPAKLMLYNDGHTLGSSVTKGAGDDNARTRADNAILTWFAKYLDGEAVSTGANVEYQDNFGGWHSASALPGNTSYSLTGSAIVASGPAPTGGGGITAANPNFNQASSRLPVFTAAQDTLLVGVPKISGQVEVTGVDAFLFFKLVNTATNDVLDDQVRPLRVSQSGSFSIDLEGVSYLLEPGESLALEISGGATPFVTGRTPAVSKVSSVVLELPVVQ